MFKSKQFLFLWVCLCLVLCVSGCIKPQQTEKPTEVVPTLSGTFYKTGSKYNYIIFNENTFIYHPNEIEKVEGTISFVKDNGWYFSFINENSETIKVIYMDQNSVDIFINNTYDRYHKQDYGHVFKMTEDNGVITFPGTHKEYTIRLDNDITFKVNSTTFDMHTVMLNIGNRHVSLAQYLHDGKVHTLQTNEQDSIFIINDEGFYETETPTNVSFSKGVLTWDWFSLNNPFYGFDVYANGELLTTTFDYKVLVYENSFRGISHNKPVEFVVVARGDRYFADSKPAILKSIYQVPTFNIRFHHNDGSNIVTTRETIDYKISNFIPERAGYVFNAWYVSHDNGQTLLYDWSSTMNVSRDLDLYAEWVVAQPNVIGRTLLRSPALSTFGTQLSWRHIDGARGYRVVITNPNSEVLDDYETSSISLDYMYYMQANPYLMVRVTALGSESHNTINSQPSTRVLYPLSTQSSIQFNYNMNTNVIIWQEEFSSYINSQNQIHPGMNTYGNFAYLDRSLDVGDYTLELDNGAIFNYTNRTLPMPKNVLITHENGELNISFEGVEHSNLYDIVIDGIVYSTTHTYYKILLEQNHMYTIQIIARDTTANYFKSYPYTYKFMISGDFYFEQYSHNELELIHYDGDASHLVLDESYGGKILTVIGSNVLDENSNVKKITLSKRIHTIKPYAFYNIALNEIMLSEDSELSLIGNQAFNAVDFRIMYFPNDRIRISGSFSSEVVLIAIEKTDNHSGDFTYRGLSKDDVLTYQNAFDYIVIDNEITIIKGYQQPYVCIPETIDGIPVKHIAYDAFKSDTELKWIYIPASIEKISGNIFSYQTAIYTAHTSTPEEWYFYSEFITFGITNLYVDENSGIAFSIENNQAYVLNTSFQSRVVIPSSIQSLPVVGIHEHAFRNHHTLKSLYIPQSITDTSGLSQVTSFTVLYFEGEAPQLEHSQFYKIYQHISLSSIHIHENNVEYFIDQQNVMITVVHTMSPTIFNIPGYNVTSIHDFAFARMRTEQLLILPSTLTFIGDQAFIYTEIRSIYIPISIQRIQLSNVSVVYTQSSQIPPQWQISGARFIVVDSPESIKNDGVSYEYIIYYGVCIMITRYYGEDTIIKLPNMLSGLPVTHIASGAFSNYYGRMKELYIPSSVISISVEYYRGDYHYMTVYIENSQANLYFPYIYSITTVVWNYNPLES